MAPLLAGSHSASKSFFSRELEVQDSLTANPNKRGKVELFKSSGVIQHRWVAHPLNPDCLDSTGALSFVRRSRKDGRRLSSTSDRQTIRTYRTTNRDELSGTVPLLIECAIDVDKSSSHQLSQTEIDGDNLCYRQLPKNTVTHCGRFLLIPCYGGLRTLHGSS
jgi:hypothetical protein